MPVQTRSMGRAGAAAAVAEPGPRLTRSMRAAGMGELVDAPLPAARRPRHGTFSLFRLILDAAC
jgi:hypothetical protein